MTLQRVASMKLALGQEIGLMSSLWRIKAAERNGMAHVLELSRKAAVSTDDAQHSGFAVDLRTPAVLNIDPLRHVPKVAPCIVVFDAVNVIHNSRWPTACHVQEGQPMGIALRSSKTNKHVSQGGMQRSSDLACLPSLEASQPAEDACIGIVGVMRAELSSQARRIKIAHGSRSCKTKVMGSGARLLTQPGSAHFKAAFA